MGNKFGEGHDVFLVTTSREEFWDQKKKIIFLQDGCKLFSRRHIWEGLDHETFQFCLDTGDKTQTALEVCSKVYEKALEELGKVLNQYHDIDKGAKYYKIILGAWLETFVKQLYEKYIVLREFKKYFPEFDTSLLSENQHIIPMDRKDFAKKISTDEYALQMYSQILEILGGHFQCKSLANPLAQPSEFRVNCGMTRKILSIMSSVHHQLNRTMGRPTLVITHPYCSKMDILSFIIKSRFKYVLDEFLCPIKIPVMFDLQARDSFSINLENTEFERLLSKMLFKHLPFAYVEGFKDVRKLARQLKLRKEDVYFTGTGLQGNLLYSFFIAENYQDITFLIHQHGAGYRLSKDNSIERLEVEIADCFYTWGWKGEKCKVLPHPKVCNLSGERTTGNGLLLILEESERYIYRMQYRARGATFLKKYVEPLFCFLDNIQEGIDIGIRPHTLDRGWEVPSRIQNRYQKRSLKILSGKFKSVVFSARICVHMDPFSTTFLETLAANIPTIAFFDPDLNRIREESQEYIGDLLRAEILYQNPREAAEKLNSAFDEVEVWWKKPIVQDARSRFVRQFARTSKDWQADWRKEFDEVLEWGV